MLKLHAFASGVSKTVHWKMKGADVSLFNECLNNPKVSKTVENDISEGELIGVQGTPAFFIGRVNENKLVDVRALYGAQSFSSFSRVIKALSQE